MTTFLSTLLFCGPLDRHRGSWWMTLGDGCLGTLRTPDPVSAEASRLLGAYTRYWFCPNALILCQCAIFLWIEKLFILLDIFMFCLIDRPLWFITCRSPRIVRECVHTSRQAGGYFSTLPELISNLHAVLCKFNLNLMYFKFNLYARFKSCSCPRR